MLIRQSPSGPIIADLENTGPSVLVLNQAGDYVNPIAQAPFEEFYVDSSVANSGDGSLSAPFKTIDEALVFAAASTVKTSIYLSAGEYDSELLYYDIFPKGYRLIGLDRNYISGNLEFASLSNRTYSFTATPPFIANEYISYDLVFIEGPSDFLPNLSRTIVQNTISTISLADVHTNAANASPVAGDIFRVAEPAAIIKLKNPGVIGNGPVWYPTLYGGKGANNSYVPAQDTGEIMNISLRSDASPANITTLKGSFELNGAHFINNSSIDNEIHAYNSFIEAGQVSNSFSRERPHKIGWGISTRSLSSRNTRCLLNNCNFAGIYCGGEFNVREGFTLLNGGAYIRDRPAGYPHGVIGCGMGGYLGVAGNEIWCNSSVNEPDIHAEYHGHIDFYTTNFHHQSTRGFCLARFGSSMLLLSEPIIDGSNADIVAQRQSQVNLSGHSFAAQACRAGVAPTLLRAASAWTVGENILQQADSTSAATLKATMPGCGSTIYRSV